MMLFTGSSPLRKIFEAACGFSATARAYAQTVESSLQPEAPGKYHGRSKNRMILPQNQRQSRKAGQSITVIGNRPLTACILNDVQALGLGRPENIV
jgi:hypothetical protein